MFNGVRNKFKHVEVLFIAEGCYVCENIYIHSTSGVWVLSLLLLLAGVDTISVKKTYSLNDFRLSVNSHNNQNIFKIFSHSSIIK